MIGFAGLNKAVIEELSNYWTFVRLKASGGYRIDQIAIAQTYFNRLFPDPSSSKMIQTRLLENFQANEPEAGLCLRCFISHCILQECRTLCRQFGQFYQFSETELLSHVLNDDSALSFTETRYLPLSYQVIKSFDPDQSSLSTWTARLVRQHPALNHFLKEQGCVRVSDWALLNDTQPKRLLRLLRQTYQWGASQTEQAVWILQSYHNIYRADRIAQGLTGACIKPTAEQFDRMIEDVRSQFGWSVSSEAIEHQLHKIAQCLRERRLNHQKPISLSDQATQAKVESLMTQTDDPHELDAEQFLKAYRSSVDTCLATALQTAVETYAARITTSAKRKSYLEALALFYCERVSMTQIARRLGLSGQPAVSRLLKLEAFQADIRLNMLICLKNYVLELAQTYVDADRLIKLDQTLEAVLSEEIKTVTEAEARQTPTVHRKPNLFDQQLCAYLDRR